MDFNGFFLVLIGPFVFLFVLISLHKSFIVVMDSDGSLWVFIVPYAFLWILGGPYGF